MRIHFIRMVLYGPYSEDNDRAFRGTLSQSKLIFINEKIEI